jgi:hypothetical protein
MMAYRQLKWLYRALRYRLEKQEIKLVQRHLAPGDVAVDVGAHKGAYTWWMRRAVGESGRVYAFEPQPALADNLRGLGYSGYFVDRSGCVDIDEFDPAVHQARSGTPGYVNNFLFLKAPAPAVGA